MREKLIRFMYGRYGIDSFGKFLIGVAVLFAVFSNFSELGILSLLTWAFFIYAYFRMFSKNIYQRSLENQAYLKHIAQLRGFFLKHKNLLLQRKTHHIYKCPCCKQKIRIPRGKGKIEIRCPKCQTTFIKKS